MWRVFNIMVFTLIKDAKIIVASRGINTQNYEQASARSCVPDQKMQGRARMPHQLDLLPVDRPGIYFVRLALPPKHELGLLRIPGESWDCIEFRVGLSEILKRFSNALNKFVARGSLIDGYARHIGRFIDVTAASRERDSITENVFLTLESASHKECCELYSFLCDALAHLPPVYIGISSERSLRHRILEHIDGVSTLQDKLMSANLIWDDTVIDWISASWNRKSLRAIEKIAQELHRPIFSKL